MLNDNTAPVITSGETGTNKAENSGARTNMFIRLEATDA